MQNIFQSMKCRDIRRVLREIGNGTFSFIGLCKIVKRGKPSRGLHAIRTCSSFQLRRDQCALFHKGGKVSVRSGMFQLRRELSILRRLVCKSPYIVQLEAVMKSRESPSIQVLTRFAGVPIMEFVETTRLYSAWVNDGSVRFLYRRSREACQSLYTLTTADVRTCLLQVLSAMAVVHELGIVHKDVKPENVLVNCPFNRWVEWEEGERVFRCASYLHERPIHVTLIDFNVSEVPKSGGGRIFDAQGTNLFSPPECFRLLDKKKGIDGFARDIWSVGVLAYCFLNGSPPVSDERSIAVQVALMTMKESPRLPGWVEDNQLRRVVESMLELDPAKRPSAREAMAALQVG